MKERCCDNCSYFHWYEDYCEKWNCEINPASIQPCFTEQKEDDENE